MTDHPQVEVKDASGVLQRIDKGLKPLLTLIWSKGMKTILSCQSILPTFVAEDNPQTWICFRDNKDLLVIRYLIEKHCPGIIVISRIRQRYNYYDIWFPSNKLKKVLKVLEDNL